jgi:Poly(hydroxyalcanoate) granule associated protein (phasin)
MSEANFIQDGIDRVQSAFQTLDKEYRRLQRTADKRRKEFEKRAERQIKRFQTELRKNPIVKRAEGVRARVDEARGEARQAMVQRLETLLGSLHVATRTEIEKLDRKLAQLNKKVRDLEKGTAA